MSTSNEIKREKLREKLLAVVSEWAELEASCERQIINEIENYFLVRAEDET